MNRLLIVGRVDPEAEPQVVDIFTEADQSELPAVTGLRHRSLYRIGDLYVHLMETTDDALSALEQGRDHPVFLRTIGRLAGCTKPYLPNARSPRDGMARCFYHWDR